MLCEGISNIEKELGNRIYDMQKVEGKMVRHFKTMWFPERRGSTGEINRKKECKSILENERSGIPLMVSTETGKKKIQAYQVVTYLVLAKWSREV